jgi:hypothetical protein
MALPGLKNVLTPVWPKMTILADFESFKNEIEIFDQVGDVSSHGYNSF